MEALEKVQQLKNELDSFRPLNAEAEARIMQKFRLDWNYHSNNIEGNSLTYGETKAFLLFGITAGKKPFKDYLEIKGHNEAINWVLSLVKGETELTEVFIRELHTLLLKESSESFAQTPDGKPTTKKIEVGKYKTLPNHVLTATGEMFYFASPEETPAKMQELIDWYRVEREKSDVNPIILATLFHYRFIRIHPFDDGNGRTARILMNFILMQNGFPPVIIKTEDKENYYGVLRLADVGELEPFIEYIGENLTRSLEIMIRGAKGEDIEEPDDLDKELALLDRKLDILGEKANRLFSPEVFSLFLTNIFVPLSNKFIEISKKFERFYSSTDYSIIRNPNIYVSTDQASKKEIRLYPRSIDSLNEILENKLNQEFYYPNGNLVTYELLIQCKFNSFSRILKEDVNYSSFLSFVFHERYYSLISEDGTTIFEKGYASPITESEFWVINKRLAQNHRSFIESEITKLNSSSQN